VSAIANASAELTRTVARPHAAHTSNAQHGKNPAAYRPPALKMCERFYATSAEQSLFHAGRLISASDSVRGISLGQAFTQFCACRNPHAAVSHHRLNSLFRMHCAGRMLLNNRTWLKIAAPMKLCSHLTCGQNPGSFRQEAFSTADMPSPALRERYEVFARL